MQYRKIELILNNIHPHWVGNGFYVKQYLPLPLRNGAAERFSPFVLLDYNEPCDFKASLSEVGVGAHPHKGFETVTFVYEGKIAHGDNQGNTGVIEAGDIQWMTAGRGILHKEHHEKEYAKNDRKLHVVQLWVNLPRKHKNEKPKYQAITADRMGKHTDDDGKLTAIVYAGEAFGVKGPASTYSPMNIYKIDLQKGKSIAIDENPEYNTGMLMLSGAVSVNGQSAVSADFVLFENDGGTIAVEAVEDSQILVLSGQPLNEPVVAYGPFVMNTKEEIVQANIDFRSGKFGAFDF